MVILKSEKDLADIRKACQIWKEAKTYITNLLDQDCHHTLLELDQLLDQFIVSKGASSTFYQMYGFPKHICMSVNDTIIHGIPNNYYLTKKDKITFDMGVTYHNHVCDAAFNWLGPECSEEQKRIVQVAQTCLEEAIKIVKPGIRAGDIGHVVQSIADHNGYFLLDGFSGHGCGNKLHEDPIIPNEDLAGLGYMLKPRMVICIEPMLLANSPKYQMHEQWDVKAINHNPTAHCEAMVLVTKDGYERLA